MIYESILDTIGNTPVVKLHNVVPDHVEMYGQGRGVQPRGFGQGPARVRYHR